MKHVAIARRVRRKIGEASLSRKGLLRLLAWLFDQLEHHAEDHVHNRVPGRPGHFQLRKNLLDNGAIHKFVFTVVDEQPGSLLVVDDCRRGT